MTRLTGGAHQQAESRAISLEMSSLDGPEEYPDYPYGPHRI
jgi:hypothetical protein